MHPKYRKHLDKEFLDTQRSKDCLGCGRPPKVDPHHFANSGGKHGNDLLAVSLCRGCHSDLHAFPKEEEWWHNKREVIWYVIVNHLMDYIEELKERDR